MSGRGLTFGLDGDRRIPEALALVPSRRLVVASPLVRFRLQPGDRVLVRPGDEILPGVPLVERTRDAALVDAGMIDVLPGPPEALPGPLADRGQGTGEVFDAPAATEAASEVAPAGDAPAGEAQTLDLRAERRGPPVPGKWWVGGEQRRGRLGRRYTSRRLAGTLLFELQGRWRAAAGERHEIVESPVAGTVREARNGIGVTIAIAGMAIPGAVAAGEPARGYLRVPDLADGELPLSALNVGLSGAIVVAGSRVGAEALTRARATAIHGIVASSMGHVDLRDLAASDARQRASLHALPPFAALGLDGHMRRPIPGPVMDLLRSLAGQDVAILTDPPLLVFDGAEVAAPEVSPDWVRVRSGPLAGREGRWLGPAGSHRFRAGIHLEAAFVRLDDDAPAVVPLGDLERFEI